MAEDTPATPPQPDQPSPLDSLEAALSGSGDSTFDQASIDELLQQASFEDPAAVSGDAGGGAGHGGAVGASPSSAAAPAVQVDTQPFNLPSLAQAVQDAQVGSIDLLRDVDLNVKIELGRARMLVEDVLKLGEGSVVELDKLAGDPVDVFVNDRLVARGEVLVLNDNFCVRVNEIVAGVKEEGL